MKVVTISQVDHNQKLYPVGRTIDLPAAEARRLIKLGVAEEKAATPAAKDQEDAK